MTPDTTTPAELPVTLAPLDALAAAGGTPTVEHVRAIAAPVVAAELRRFAAEIADDAARIKHTLPSNGSTYSDIDRADLGRVIQGEDAARMLRARADELEPRP